MSAPANLYVVVVDDDVDNCFYTLDPYEEQQVFEQLVALEGGTIACGG